MMNWYAIEKVQQREIVERQRAAGQQRLALGIRLAAAPPQRRRNASQLVTLVLFALGRR